MAIELMCKLLYVLEIDLFEMLLLVMYLYGLLTKCEVKMAGYWPSSFFASLWTDTESRLINSQFDLIHLACSRS